MDAFFKQNKEKFDVYEPKTGHQERFLSKLNQRQNTKNVKFSYKKWMIAASILLLVGLSFSYLSNYRMQRHENSEIKQSEQYFSMLIREEIESIDAVKTPETQKVFDDAMLQIKDLETAYKKLVKDYRINKDKLIINAMIENFQQRIEVLQFVKEQINEIKQPKINHHEQNRA